MTATMLSAALSARFAVARATIGGAFARERGRLALATLAIALGIALGFAIELVNRTAIAEFTSGMATLSGRADLEVRGARVPVEVVKKPFYKRNS